MAFSRAVDEGLEDAETLVQSLHYEETQVDSPKPKRHKVELPVEALGDVDAFEHLRKGPKDLDDTYRQWHPLNMLHPIWIVVFALMQSQCGPAPK